MQWNDLSYQMQMKVLDRIGDLIFEEKDEAMQFAIAAAIVELEIWANSPCTIIGEDGEVINDPFPFVANAQDPEEE